MTRRTVSPRRSPSRSCWSSSWPRCSCRRPTGASRTHAGGLARPTPGLAPRLSEGAEGPRALRLVSKSRDPWPAAASASASASASAIRSRSRARVGRQRHSPRVTSAHGSTMWSSIAWASSASVSGMKSILTAISLEPQPTSEVASVAAASTAERARRCAPHRDHSGCAGRRAGRRARDLAHDRRRDARLEDHRDPQRAREQRLQRDGLGRHDGWPARRLSAPGRQPRQCAARASSRALRAASASSLLAKTTAKLPRGWVEP